MGVIGIHFIGSIAFIHRLFRQSRQIDALPGYSCSLFPVPCSLFSFILPLALLIVRRLFRQSRQIDALPGYSCSLFPVPCSLFSSLFSFSLFLAPNVSPVQRNGLRNLSVLRHRRPFIPDFGLFSGLKVHFHGRPAVRQPDGRNLVRHHQRQFDFGKILQGPDDIIPVLFFRFDQSVVGAVVIHNADLGNGRHVDFKARFFDDRAQPGLFAKPVFGFVLRPVCPAMGNFA